MRHVIEILRSNIPSDCFDLDYHIENVMRHNIDTTNQCELFIYYYLAGIVRDSNPTPIRLGRLTYIATESSIFFAWEVL